MVEQVRRLIAEKQLLLPNDYVLVGVSGGPDSVALLHFLWQYRQEWQIHLHVVHINHQLRGDIADEETAYVQNLAAQLGLPCSVCFIPVADYARANGLSLEQAGHILRFQYFQQIAQETGANKLALGHHRGDKVETMLLNLLRGCGPEGLTAMPVQEGWLIRPLLAVDKTEVLAYCQKQQLTYYLDGSNAETDYLRNKIRLELLPLLEQEYNPKIQEHLLRLAELSQDEQEDIEKLVIRLWHQHGIVDNGQVAFPVNCFRQQSIAVQRRLIRFGYTRFKGDNHGLSFRLIEHMRQCALGDVGEKQIHLPEQLLFVKNYQQISWQRQTKIVKDGQGYCYSWSLNRELWIEEAGYLFSCQPLNHLSCLQEQENLHEQQREAYWTVAVDAASLPLQLTIRSRRAGDNLQLVGMSGRKKLKTFFIDRKIPVGQRDTLPLLVAGEEIVWIPGYFLAEQIRVTEKTTQYVFLCCKKIK